MGFLFFSGHSLAIVVTIVFVFGLAFGVVSAKRENCPQPPGSFLSTPPPWPGFWQGKPAPPGWRPPPPLIPPPHVPGAPLPNPPPPAVAR